MNNLNKHIAAFLFGIFFFPIAYQSTHIVWHHFNANNCEHQQCLAKTIHCYSHHNDDAISQKEEICPICEFQFSLNDIPLILTFRSDIPVTTCTLNEIATDQQYKQVFRDKSPRAPPVYMGNHL